MTSDARGDDDPAPGHIVTFPPGGPAARPLRILVLTRYGRTGASSRMRFLQFIHAFEAHAVNPPEFTISPLLDDVYIARLYTRGHRVGLRLAHRYLARAAVLLTARRYDGLWIEKELFPGLPAWPERLLATLGVRMVVDYDDATFVFYKYTAHPLVRALMPAKIEQVCRAATVVTAGNAYLTDFARAAGATAVATQPTVVDPAPYAGPRPQRRDAPLVIGWIGSPSTAPYLHLYAEALALAQAVHGVRILTIGAPQYTLPGVALEPHPWSEATEAELLASCDIALAPLEKGAFEQGKCSFKVIQCMAAGLPVIASPFGVNRDVVQHGVDGFLAETTAEVLSAMDVLSDPVRRAAIGAAGRRKIHASFSIETGKHAVAAVLIRAFGVS